MLCTLQQIKDTLGITGNASDTLLTRLGNAASTFIEGYCNRTFTLAAYTDVFNGDGSNTYHTREYPITTLNTITHLVGDYDSGDWDTLDSSFYDFEPLSGIIFSHHHFSKGFQNWQVSYSAGYATIPYDIEDACIKLACYGYNSLNTQGIKAETMGDRRVEYFTMTTSSPINELGLDDVLAKYRQPLV